MSKTPTRVVIDAGRAVRDFLAGRTALSQLYGDDELERVEIVRNGFPARGIDILSARLDVPKATVFELLGVSRATADRLTKSGKNLSPSATERAVFFAGLVKKVEDMIPVEAVDRESFQASKWVVQWLEEPQPALGGKTPGSFMDTADGRRIVNRLLGQLITGTYA